MGMLTASASLISDMVHTRASLKVESPAFKNGDLIPKTFAGDGKNVSPEIRWQSGPEGTACYCLIVEDPDAPKDVPFVHWILTDIPANVTSIGEGRTPQGAKSGINDFGSPGYYGPKPPVGHGVHHYHFEIFALDKKLQLTRPVKRPEFIEAIDGHILAGGKTVGTYSR